MQIIYLRLTKGSSAELSLVFLVLHILRQTNAKSKNCQHLTTQPWNCNKQRQQAKDIYNSHLSVGPVKQGLKALRPSWRASARPLGILCKRICSFFQLTLPPTAVLAERTSSASEVLQSTKQSKSKDGNQIQQCKFESGQLEDDPKEGLALRQCERGSYNWGLFSSLSAFSSLSTSSPVQVTNSAWTLNGFNSCRTEKSSTAELNQLMHMPGSPFPNLFGMGRPAAGSWRFWDWYSP